jgi:hypothetical protein
MMFKRFFAYQEVNSGGSANIPMRAHGQPACQRITNAHLLQLGGDLDGGVPYLRGNESEYVLEIHKTHLTTGDLSVGQMHHKQSIARVVEFGKQTGGPRGAPPH